MIPVLEDTERNIACTLTNNNIIDAFVDLMFGVSGAATATGIYLALTGNQVPPGFGTTNQGFGTTLAIMGIQGMLVTSIYRLIVPTLESECR